MLIKPTKLQHGDFVATVSLSWGGAGDPELKWRYEQGVNQLQNTFGLQVIAMPNSLKGASFLYENPQARAEDFMQAFQNPKIKAIIANIGGDDSIRLLPYIDFEVIAKNPKIFIGYSDSTISHLFCLKAGLSSMYGPALLTDFAENNGLFDYTIEAIDNSLFSSEVIGEVLPAKEWTSERIEWLEENKKRQRTMQPNRGYELLQGEGGARGRLIGGCIEVLEFAKSTVLWPEDMYWENSILFFETSEEQPHPNQLMYWLRNYGTQGILQKAKGLLFAKPYDEKYDDDYKTVIVKVMKEFQLTKLPVLYNINFGHTEPKIIIPFGALAEINAETGSWAILENAVVDKL